MKLCMFSPRELELERGWPGRIDGDKVVQLAAQTLQAFFTGGGQAREHAEYPLADVLLRAPVLHPPAIRVFQDATDFSFANPAAIAGPDDRIHLPAGVAVIRPVLRLAAVIGAGTVGGFTLMNEWHAPGLAGVKQRDFAISLGPVVLTPDELDGELERWDALVDLAEQNTRLLPGDVIASPDKRVGEPVVAGETVELTLGPFGTLRNEVVPPPTPFAA